MNFNFELRSDVFFSLFSIKEIRAASLQNDSLFADVSSAPD